jgi:catecholate siderophore receptor
MIGYGATYTGAYTFNRASATAALFYTPDYWVHRAMISYGISRSAVLQLNINNLFDEHYYTRIRNNATSGWATPGEARNAVLSLNYRF